MSTTDFTTQFALFINGEIICQSPPTMGYLSALFSAPPKPVVFDTKAEAESAAAQIRSNLRETYHIDPVVTVAHRYCSAWNVQPLGADIVKRFERLLDEEGL
ncbi:hypothetical protein [Gordonia soli]|uniref:Uncharacterized protein n=1 Tax=Gordonia soli NBRC 108243 TaxID=1223545 RepID=M0QR45_9ACTN|nr:hypothetical protein [Gordonia soli]GAC71083.1 hypothetical protein GS4_51_00210 [Gordonia soli NBRC 108243]